MKKVIQYGGLPIKLWLDDIEDGALEQAKNLAELPFAFKHIAIMPDSHQGYGMPIGGVMATKGYIVPNAVGVDIGCFSGDTKIPLLNGTQKTLKELYDAGMDVYVYSLDENLRIVPGKATPKLTRKNAELMEVVVSGGESIKCTPDHQFMLTDGTYKKAEDLQNFDSLMPLYRTYQTRDGYEFLKTTSSAGCATHRMVAKYFIGEGTKCFVVHHKDGNWFNNDPSNLEYKSAKDHSRHHGLKNETFKKDSFKEKRLLTLRENGFFSPIFKEKKKSIALANLDAYNKSEEKKENDKLSGKRGAKFLIAYNKSANGRAKSSENGKKYGFKRNNHKLLFTKKISRKEDVYCLTVEKHHNFALSAGVFVHNCGMCAIKTSLLSLETKTLKQIMGEIRKRIPVGFNHQEKIQDKSLMPEDDSHYPESVTCFREKYPVVSQQYNSALYQIGTLGGGNHFIEIQKGSDGFIWVMIHSGSRNFGLKVAEYYNHKAIELNQKYFCKITKEKELAFLDMEDEGQQYFDEMNYCVKFALANRKLMMDRVEEIFYDITKCGFEPMINIAHNYAAMEHHFGQDVLVHRKGATLAREDTIGIIPGSQGTKSYIVTGKGNPESFHSCSHGAGRKMGRKEAQRTLNLDAEKKMLDDQGIIHAIRNAKDLDEAPSAYKDINVVMANQLDLIDILAELSPLGVIKA